MAIQKESTTHNFTFKGTDFDLTFNVQGTSRTDALTKLRQYLASCISDINEDLKNEKV